MAVDQGVLKHCGESGPKVSGRSRRVATDQGWSLRGVPVLECTCHVHKLKLHA